MLYTIQRALLHYQHRTHHQGMDRSGVGGLDADVGVLVVNSLDGETVDAWRTHFDGFKIVS